MTRNRHGSRLLRFWRDEDGVATAEWVALAGAAAIGGVALFWWATSTSAGFQPMANTIQNQVDSAAHTSVQTSP